MRLSYCLGYLEYNRKYPSIHPYIHNIPVHTSNFLLSDLCVRCLPSNHTVVLTHTPWRENSSHAVMGTHYDSRACTVSDTYILRTPIQDSTGAEFECCPPTAVTSYFTNSNDPIMKPLYTELDNQDTVIHMSPTFMDLSLHLLSAVRGRAFTPGVPCIMI